MVWRASCDGVTPYWTALYRNSERSFSLHRNKGSLSSLQYLFIRISSLSWNSWLTWNDWKKAPRGARPGFQCPPLLQLLPLCLLPVLTLIKELFPSLHLSQQCSNGFCFISPFSQLHAVVVGSSPDTNVGLPMRPFAHSMWPHSQSKFVRGKSFPVAALFRWDAIFCQDALWKFPDDSRLRWISSVLISVAFHCASFQIQSTSSSLSIPAFVSICISPS